MSSAPILTTVLTLIAVGLLHGGETASAPAPAPAPAATDQTGLVGWVSTLQGTDSTPGLSHGNTLPLVGMPWGMLNWAVENSGGTWYFHPNQTIDGIRATHQPSPWIGDYGAFVVMPQQGAQRLAREARMTDYAAASAVFRPDYQRLDLEHGAITAELTGTERCGVLRSTFHGGTSGRLVVEVAGSSELVIAGRTMRGVSRRNSGGAGSNFGCYFLIAFDRAITLSGSVVSHGSGAKATPKDDVVTAYAEFATTPADPVTVRIGTSFISAEQAERNLGSEAAGTFEQVHGRVATTWNQSLGRIAVTGPPEQLRTFYSCLYRAHMFPHRLHEVDATGANVHYSPYDGALHDGVLYGDIGIWDGFRTTFPLVTLVYPERMAEILQGFVNASAEGGMLPEWPSPGDRGGMGGQHCTAIIADAVAKGVTGFEVAKAYASLLRSASPADGHGARLRNHLHEDLTLGYIPGEVSETLDDAYDDWCIAQLARQQGHQDAYQALMVRSQAYRHLWDGEVGFMRPKAADGHWSRPFDEFAWGNGYTESGPWQASWFVPHDPAGLASLIGGRAELTAKLERMLALPSTFHVGGYPGVIHEMTEMANEGFGQYAQGNQPSFANLYLFAAMGRPWITETWTRRSCAELFSAGIGGFPGDEDNGSLASWYILSAIGLYPFCPGTPQYLWTSPLFRSITLHLAHGADFRILAPANDATHIHVQARLLNGMPTTATWIAHDELMRGGEVRLEMSEQANQATIAPAGLPYAASPYPPAP